MDIFSHLARRGVDICGSIGIIGSADGPTSIFIASKPNQWLETAICMLAIAAVAGFLIWNRRRK